MCLIDIAFMVRMGIYSLDSKCNGGSLLDNQSEGATDVMGCAHQT